MATDFLERNGSEGDHGAKGDDVQEGCMEGVDSLKEEVLSARDPTLVFHEKPSISSSSRDALLANKTVTNEPSSGELVTNGAVNILESGRENVVKVESDGEGSLSHDQSSIFSFKPGVQKAGPEKVSATF